MAEITAETLPAPQVSEPQVVSPLASALLDALGGLSPEQADRVARAVFDEASRGASVAATEVVKRGLIGFAAVSVAGIAADKLFESAIVRMLFVGGISFGAVRYATSPGDDQ